MFASGSDAGVAAPPAYDFTSLTAVVQDAVTNQPLEGASLLLVKDGQTIYEQHFGSYDAATYVPIASASKWVSASIFMTLVDEGVFSLDDPVSAYLPEWTGQMGSITMRQLWSHTSGLPGDHPCLGDYSITIANCVEQIRQGGLIAPPGSQFYYGGASMQVAGRVAEVATGQTWQQLFFNRIRVPLGMTSAIYNLGPNPRIGGGVNSTLHDYGKLLQMHLEGGVYGQSAVLTLDSVQEMQKDQTFGVPIAYSPHPTGARYGLGVWRDLAGAGGEPIQLSSQGAFGFSPWLDNKRGYFGVFLVQDQLANVYTLVAQIQATMRSLMDAHDTDGDGQQDSVDADDDNDSLSDAFERSCGSFSADAASFRPERLDGPFSAEDDDGDTQVDELLPGAAFAFDCDGDGYIGSTEDHVYSSAGARDQDACGNDGWPADLVSIGPSANRINLTDLSSFIAPEPRKLGSSPGGPGYDVRWDLVPGAPAGPKINIVDISNISLLKPPMLGGNVRAFSGPVCPWPP